VFIGFHRLSSAFIGFHLDEEKAFKFER